MPITTPPPFVLHTGRPVFAARRSPAELEAENALLRSEVARLRAGEEPCDLFQVMSTGAHLLWILGNSSADVRQQIAGAAVRAMETADRCVTLDHDNNVRFHRMRNARLEHVVEDTRAEARRLAAVSDGTGRGVAMALMLRLSQAAA
ncbi:hypothetical protein [Streptomyces sp. NPDC004267]|uniref:hypothetical protein n=1 Tax=Streptomyces sp. NPDC004267 TaxID=3364694 RepID=UPI003690AADC